MSFLGDFRLGDTFDTKFCTVSTTGAPTQLAGTPVISAYVGNSTTQITAGITLTVDFDAVTGLNNVRVVATSGNGFATASNYQLVITTGTVGGTSVVGYVVAEFSIEARSAVMPTTAARTLDVSAAGEAGIDWANIGSPTTAQALTGTTVDLIAGAVDAAAIATGAIDADAIAADAITAAKIADGAIDAATFAAGAINAAAIATGAIDADALAADAATEIANAVWDTDATARQTAGTFGQAIGDPGADANTIYGSVVTGAAGATIAADIVSIQADTDNIQTRIPAALVGGRIDASVGAMAADVVTAAAVANGAIDAATFAAGAIDAAAIATGAIDADALAADAGTEIGTAVWATAARTLTAATNITSTGGTTVPQTGDNFARLGAPAGASVSADIAAIQADLPQRITKNVALAAFPFKMVQSADHVTPATGVAVTATRSLDGAAFAACANAVVEISNGWYRIDLAATDLNANTVALKFTAAATDQVDVTVVTEPT